MADGWGSIAFEVRLDETTGALPLSAYQSAGSTRQVVSSAISVTQYTGTGLGTIELRLYLSSTDYGNLLSAYRTFPRVSDTLTVGGDNLGDWFIDALADAERLLNDSVFVTATFREDT